MWWVLAYVPYEVAIGILGILVPLYAVNILGESLIFVGGLGAAWSLMAIPASILWGLLCDRVNRYKLFVSLSFLLSGAIIYALSAFRGSFPFLLSFAALSCSFSAYRPATNVIIAESTAHEEWKGVMVRYIFARALARAFGVALGSFTIAMLQYAGLFSLCVLLSSASFLLSLALVSDPPILMERSALAFERWLTSRERALQMVELAYTSGYGAYMSRGLATLRGGGFIPFLIGSLTFSFATNLIFIPLPILLQSALPDPSTVFLVFFFNSLVGAFAYLAAASVEQNVLFLKVSSLARGFLALLILPSLALPYPNSLYLVAALLASMGCLWSLFDVSSNYLSIILTPIGSSGVYFAALELGNILGAFLGGFIPLLYGWQALYISGSLVFTLSFILFLRIPEVD